MPVGTKQDSPSAPDGPEGESVAASRLSLYGAGALVLLAAGVGVGLHRGNEAFFLLPLLALALAHLFLYRRQSRSSRDLSHWSYQVRRALWESEALRDLSREISAQVQLGALLDLIAQTARDLLGADYAYVATLDEDTGGTTWATTVGFKSEGLLEAHLPAGKGLAGRAISSGRPVVVEGFGQNPDFPVDEFPFHRAEGMIAALSVPLIRGARKMGALGVAYRRQHSFTEQEIILLDALSAQAVVALENARLYAEETRRAAELAAVIDHINDGVIATDRHGRVVRSNEVASRLLGELTIGESLLSLVERSGLRVEGPAGEVLQPADSPLARATRGEQFTGQEAVLRRGDGSTRHLVIDGRPVAVGRGNEVLAITVIHDVTAAREMDQLKDEFLSLAAHELKTPLTSLKGYAQILMGSKSNGFSEGQQRALQVINRQADRVNRMVEQFLQVAEIRSGRLSLQPRRVDLHAMVASVCEEIAQAATSREIRYRPQGPVEVVADPRSLDLVLSNLTRNAVRYSPEGGVVEISAAVVGSEAIVSVRDSGIGIPVQKQDHIFERFYQVQPGTVSQGGIGLGLYISHELIVRQGGRMWLESKEGEGSSFFFALPVAPDRMDSEHQP